MTRSGQADMWSWFEERYVGAQCKQDDATLALCEAYFNGAESLGRPPEYALTCYERGKALAEKHPDPYWSLFFDTQIITVCLHHTIAYQRALDRAVRAAVEARHPVYERCPMRGTIYRLLIEAYIEYDPIGYGDKIFEAREYLIANVALDPESELILQARHAEMLLLFGNIAAAQAETGKYLGMADSGTFHTASAYELSCRIAYSRGDFSAALRHAEAAEAVAEQNKLHTMTMLSAAWQGLIHARLRHDISASHFMNRAFTLSEQVGFVSTLMFDPICWYFETRYQERIALKWRMRQLDYAVKSGIPHHECVSHLKLCSLLKRMWLHRKQYQQALTAARSSAARLIDPAWFIRKLDALEGK